MDTSLDTAFKNAPKYAQKDLAAHFGDIVTMREQDLDRESEDFLRVITTWVVRAYANRRKGGVPTGQLERFAYPEGQKIDLVRTLMIHIIKVLRKRGLKEWDMQQKSATFESLVRAYDTAAQKSSRR